MNRFRHEEIFNQADLDIKDGYYEDAFKKLESILIEDPTYGKAYNHMGWMYETKFRDYGKAEEMYQRALETMPNYPPIYSNYTILLSTLRKFDKLKEVVAKGMTVAGVDHANLYNELGIMHEQSGEYDQAIENYTNCAKQTLSKDTLDRAMASIDRCKQKQKL